MRRTDIVATISQIIKRVAPSAKTILYGSEARGDARSDSDIDLLILLEEPQLTPEREQEIIRPLYELEVKTGIIISPMIILRKLWESRPFQTPFSINVMNEGIVL
ncbi:MAG: nucleotidyltransferase domain-containing protein [Parabacteroides sp.]|nr:nucleotidyltransferase domain-containing protein [Parabacteroides sp.]